MKIILVHYYHGEFDEDFTSIIDTYYNLKRLGFAPKLKIITKNLEKTVDRMSRYFGDKNLLQFATGDYFEADIIICSSRLLFNNFDVPLETLVFNAKKIIVLDSIDIPFSSLAVETKYGIIPPLHEITNYDCILLCNPSGVYSCQFETIEYYHKFSNERLSNKIYKDNFLKNINYSKVYNYSRSMHYTDYLNHSETFNENIGKIIFESVFYGIPVNYYFDIVMFDGLSYYLRLFGLNPSFNYLPLPIDKSDIEDKLFMKEDDPLIRIIERFF
jgi:hypothetical protein